MKTEKKIKKWWENCKIFKRSLIIGTLLGLLVGLLYGYNPNGIYMKMFYYFGNFDFIPALILTLPFTLAMLIAYFIFRCVRGECIIFIVIVGNIINILFWILIVYIILKFIDLRDIKNNKKRLITIAILILSLILLSLFLFYLVLATIGLGLGDPA